MTRFRVLFVCIGNVCRSPLGQHLLAARLPADLFEVSSAGVGALVGAPMDALAASHLEQQGLTADDFAARQLSPEIVEQSDLVLTATRGIRSRVLEDAPRALRRTFTVLEFAALLDTVSTTGDPAALVADAAQERSRVVLDEYDIPDPYGRGETAHAEAAATMLAAVERIAKGLAQ